MLRTVKYFIFLFIFLISTNHLLFADESITNKNINDSSSSALSVATIERPPFSFFDEQKNLTGFSIELWEEIAKRNQLNFSWNHYKQFGEMIMDTVSGKNHMAIANISITSSREIKGDFSQPIFESGMSIAVRKDTKASFFSLIWESGILLFLAGALLILIVIAHVVWFFERGIEDSRHDYFRDDYFGGIWDAFWWAFIIMTMGGFENEVPKKIINRLLAMFWIIVSLFFISTLTAKITTALTVAELKTGIESYKDLSSRKVGVTKGSTHERFLNQEGIKTAPFDTIQALYKNLKEEKLDAIVADYPILSFHASNQAKDWMILAGEPFNPDNYGIYLPENSIHYEKINQTLLKIKDEAFYKSLYDKYFDTEN